MSEIKEVDTRKSTRKWMRPALAAITIVAILAVLMTWQPWNSSPQSIMVKAQSAIADLQSYRFSLIQTSNTEGETSEAKVEVEFSAPDRYHVIQTGDEDDLEFILISDEQYYKDSYVSLRAMKSQAGIYSSMLEATLKMLDYLTDIQKLPDETMDGTRCLRYRGVYDIEKQWTESLRSRQERGIPPISDEEMEERLEELRPSIGSTTVELWIGRDDYLLRQMKWDSQRPDTGDGIRYSSMIFKFYDFNEPFTVEAPVDSNGKLLPGWTSASPEYPHIGTDIQVDVDNYDPSDRKVNYSITLTNISVETLTDVDVEIISAFPEPYENPDERIWFSWENCQWTKGPYILDPGESLEYSCIFGYDATSVQPEIIAETIEDSYIEVSYFIPDGQQKAEIFHFEAPESIYTLSTVLPPHLVPIKLTVSGEYRIEEPGATYTGNGISGEINGREYLFVEINTAGAEVPAPPGVLVLDIRDKTRPRKVAYISTDDDTRYIRGATLYGTVLYVSADDFLWVIDVSDPSAPGELSRLPGLDTTQMIVSGKYAFINDGNHDIVTLDLSDPTQPERIGHLPLSSSTGIQMDIYGDYLLAEANDILYTIDASSPSSLEIVNEHSFRAAIDDSTPWIEYPLHIMGTEIEDEYAYVALSTEGKDAIGVLDLSEPANPREIAFFRLKDRQLWGSLFASGERVYLFTMKSSGQDRRTRLEIIDISNPAEPEEKGYGIMPDSWSFFDNFYSGSHQGYSLIGNHLYWFIGNSPNRPVIEVIDLSGL